MLALGTWASQLLVAAARGTRRGAAEWKGLSKTRTEGTMGRDKGKEKRRLTLLQKVTCRMARSNSVRLSMHVFGEGGGEGGKCEPRLFVLVLFYVDVGSSSWVT